MMPDRKTLYHLLDEVLDSGWLTNMGRMHGELESCLTAYLGVRNLSLFNNGTIALITALKALDLPQGSEVITTPFTFAATPHSIAWNDLKPVFADIRKEDFTLDPRSVESLINDNTSAILPVHVYGFPCDVEAFELLAKKHHLKIIYDAAHAFSTEYKGKSICSWGDISMLSFHSTKLYNTIEGGALVYDDDSLRDRIYNLRNFGIRDEVTVEEVGINGKMNELQAAWGLLTLKMVKSEQERRKNVYRQYKDRLSGLGVFDIPEFPVNATNSYQYFPVLLAEDCPVSRDHLYETLKKYNIFTRRYFYPLCTHYKAYDHLKSISPGCNPVAEDISQRILCLPFFGDLIENGSLDYIIESITTVLKGG
jgi:dTDP-4-amino-4,6-dideoxygalactose transaminase